MAMEWLFVLGLIVVVVVLPALIVTAFVMAYKAMVQVRDLRAQVDRVEGKLAAVQGALAAGSRAAAKVPPDSPPQAAQVAAPPTAVPVAPNEPPPAAAIPAAAAVIAATAAPETQSGAFAGVSPGVSPAASPAASPVPMPPTAVPSAPPPGPPSRDRAAGAGLEAQFGARLPVWIGAICLALAGVFLVKYAFDNDWLGPTVRVALGVLFGVALLVVGERSFGRTPRIPAALSAAGIAVLYASFLSAGRLYDLVPPIAAFALMALTTAVAIGLSLRQGRLIAVVGLVGGFLTPYLLGPSPDPSPMPLFAYLLLLQIGLLVVTRRRGWYELAGLTLAAGLVWVIAWLWGPYQRGDSAWLGLFLLASTAAFVAAAWGRSAADAWVEPRAARALTWAAMAAGLGLMTMVTEAAYFGTLEWVYLGILGAGAVVMGRLDHRYVALSWLAGALTAVLLMFWGRLSVLGQEPFELERSAPTFLWTVAALGAVYAIGGYVALWRAARPSVWAALSAAAGVLYFLVLRIGYLGLRMNDAPFPWGATAIILALVYIAAAVPIARRRNALALLDLPNPPDTATETDRIVSAAVPDQRSDYRQATETLAALAAAATMFISLAVPLQLERGWIGVAWALEVAALAWLAKALDVPQLRRLAWPLVVVVAMRLLYPFAFNYPIGVWPVFNWLLYGYGLPIIAFAVAAHLCTKAGDRRLAAVLEWLAMALGLYLIGLQVHHYFHPTEFGRLSVRFAEFGTLTVAWLVYALALLWAGRRWPVPSLTLGGQIVAGIALGFGLLALGIVDNPAWTDTEVGATPVFNRLLLAYGAPALLALFVARALSLRGDIDQERIWLIGAAALLFVFIGVTLEVRQFFRGTHLSYLYTGDASLAERYAYSLAWVLLGVVLLAAGIVTHGRLLRYASLAVMLIAVAKVFLYDMSNLSGLYRVFSFLGLGLSLLLLGYVYQRFVFREETP
jgi:uncharacterized membrane protein